MFTVVVQVPDAFEIVVENAERVPIFGKLLFNNTLQSFYDWCPCPLVSRCAM